MSRISGLFLGESAVQFQVHGGDAWHPVDVETHAFVIAGMTGRDLDAVQAHSAELAEIGIPPPRPDVGRFLG